MFSSSASTSGGKNLKLGEIHKLTFRGRAFDFLPILHSSPDQQAREAARSIRSSPHRCNSSVALLRHFSLIAKLIRSRRCSVDLRRVEFSWLPAVLRLPFVQMLHGEGAPKPDGLAAQEIFLRPQHPASVSPSPSPKRSFASIRSSPSACRRPIRAARTRSIRSGPVNTDIFKPQPFPASTSPFQVVFAGRLDEVHDPPLMFRTIDFLRRRRNMAASSFTTSAPATRTASPNSRPIEDITVRHGFRDAAEWRRP